MTHVVDTLLMRFLPHNASVFLHARTPCQAGDNLSVGKASRTPRASHDGRAVGEEGGFFVAKETPASASQLSYVEARELARKLFDLVWENESHDDQGNMAPEDSLACPRCKSSEVVRKGRDRDGGQRWLCRQCNRTFNASTIARCARVGLSPARCANPGIPEGPSSR